MLCVIFTGASESCNHLRRCSSNSKFCPRISKGLFLIFTGAFIVDDTPAYLEEVIVAVAWISRAAGMMIEFLAGRGTGVAMQRALKRERLLKVSDMYVIIVFGLK